MFSFTYPAIFTAGCDGRELVELVDLPRVSTDGKDYREAMEEAMDALGSDLSIRLSRREEIPAPSAPKRGQRIRSIEGHPCYSQTTKARRRWREP